MGVRPPRHLALGGALSALVLGLASPALAGRTNHLFTDESQVVPEGGVELENWVWVDGRTWQSPSRPASGWLWWAPVVGVTPHLELQLPLQIFTAADNDIVLDSVEFAMRYRIFPREQDDGWQPLFRIGYEHPLNQEYSGPPRLNVNLVSTWGSLSSVRVTANLGARIALPFLIEGVRTVPPVVGTASVGVSGPLNAQLRLAGEVFGVLPLPSSEASSGQLYAGPSLAWTRGPFWVTFGSLFGLTPASSRFLPKVLWAVAF